MKTLPVLAAVALALAASAVQAKPMVLSGSQMDRVTAGQLEGLPSFAIPNFNLNLPEGFSETLGAGISAVLSTLPSGNTDTSSSSSSSSQ